MPPAEEPRTPVPWVGYAAAILLPALLTFLFWRTTPPVGGWAQSPAPSSSAPAPSGASAPGSPDLLYAQNCAKCHGTDLAGKTGPALKRPGWPYGKNRDLLVNVIYQGRGLKMPAFGGRLTRQQIESLADYLQGANAPAP